MKKRWNSARLNSDQIPTDAIEDRLKDRNTIELINSTVQDQTSKTTNGHCNQDRGPPRVQDFLRDTILFGEIHAHGQKQDVNNDDYGR